MDRCTPDPQTEILTNSNENVQLDGLTYLMFISNINDTKQISFLPVRVCFCMHNGKSNCSYRPPVVCTKRGERFNVLVVAVDHVNHPIKNVTIYTSHIGMNNSLGGLGEGQSAQITQDYCTNLTFSIYSSHTSEELILHADGPCRNAKASQTKLSVRFQPCTYPIGFQPSSETMTVSVFVIQGSFPFFTDEDKFETNSLTRHGTFWVTFIDNYHSSSRFIIYPYCPLDCCLPPSSDIHINFDFDLVNGSDAQCAN